MAVLGKLITLVVVATRLTSFHGFTTLAGVRELSLLNQVREAAKISAGCVC